MTKHQIRWHCPACNNTGWSSDAKIPPHDNVNGSSCRKSGQVSELAAKTRFAATLSKAEGKS